MTHDYLRNGITTLFAALDVLDGTVLGRCMQRHRHQEFLRFLNTIEAAVPAGKVIHAILDNYGSHKHPKVARWLARHPRWTFHFTPTSGSWLNAVETFFSALTRRRLKRGTFHSIVDLQAAINRYIAEHNDDPKPFTWTNTPGADPRQAETSECVCALGERTGPTRQQTGGGIPHPHRTRGRTGEGRGVFRPLSPQAVFFLRSSTRRLSVQQLPVPARGRRWRCGPAGSPAGGSVDVLP